MTKPKERPTLSWDVDYELTQMRAFLNDKELKAFGLHAEMIVFAFKRFAEDPTLTPTQAINLTVDDWIK